MIWVTVGLLCTLALVFAVVSRIQRRQPAENPIRTFPDELDSEGSIATEIASDTNGT